MVFRPSSNGNVNKYSIIKLQLLAPTEYLSAQEGVNIKILTDKISPHFFMRFLRIVLWDWLL